jgi:phosphate transport system substrate-binding protein
MFNPLTIKRRILLVGIATILLGGTACNNTETAQTEAGAGSESLEVRVSGAGASFPAPLYQRWFSEFNDENPGVQISYQSVGSGAGVQQYLAGTVDFGATDAPLTDEERQRFQEQYDAAPIQVPMTGGLVVFAYNLPEIDNLQLARDTYCGIVTGEITTWDAPEIAEDNPDATLPNEPITWVHRADGSGTTFLFTNHLQAACPSWNAGAAKTVEWPTGVGAKGNEGIAAQVQQTEGAIGYVEYAYANENGISMATIENQTGEFIEPTPEAAANVFEGADIPEDFALTIPDPEGTEAYPIAGLTWLLLYPEYENQDTAAALEEMVSWALQDGDNLATELGYVPLPEDVQARVLDTVNSQLAAIQQSR